LRQVWQSSAAPLAAVLLLLLRGVGACAAIAGVASTGGGGGIVDDAMATPNEYQRGLRLNGGDCKVVMRIIKVLRAVLDARQNLDCELGDEPYGSRINADM
jgi:hypothetical protein